MHLRLKRVAVDRSNDIDGVPDQCIAGARPDCAVIGHCACEGADICGVELSQDWVLQDETVHCRIGSMVPTAMPRMNTQGNADENRTRRVMPLDVLKAFIPGYMDIFLE